MVTGFLRSVLDKELHRSPVAIIKEGNTKQQESFILKEAATKSKPKNLLQSQKGFSTVPTKGTDSSILLESPKTTSLQISS